MKKFLSLILVLGLSATLLAGCGGSSDTADSGDSGDVQQVSYISGGDAYYFSRGAVQHGRWEKASPEHPLLVYDKTGAQMLFNRGKTYLAIEDDDEWSNFSYQ